MNNYNELFKTNKTRVVSKQESGLSKVLIK